MTDTPTPPAMTPEQRAELVARLRDDFYGEAETVADQLAADGVTIATLTAERDELQAAIDGIEISNGLTTNGNLWRLWARMAKDSAAKTKEAQAEIARLTAALATAREDGMREAVDIARVEAAGLRAKSEAPLVGGPQHMRWVAGAIQSDNIANYIEAAITKGAAT